MIKKLEALAALVQKESIERLVAQKLNCPANINNCTTSIKAGNKYTKIDIGHSGKLMIENSTGNIYGVKAYGVIHKGHQYGTLDTIKDYFWGYYYPIKKEIA